MKYLLIFSLLILYRETFANQLLGKSYSRCEKDSDLSFYEKLEFKENNTFLETRILLNNQKSDCPNKIEGEISFTRFWKYQLVNNKLMLTLKSSQFVIFDEDWIIDMNHVNLCHHGNWILYQPVDCTGDVLDVDEIKKGEKKQYLIEFVEDRLNLETENGKKYFFKKIH